MYLRTRCELVKVILYVYMYISLTELVSVELVSKKFEKLSKLCCFHTKRRQ